MTHILLAAALLLTPPASAEAAVSSPTTRGVAVTRVGNRTARVELRVYPAAVDVGQAPRAILVNSGRVALGYSYPFSLARKTRHGWRVVNCRQGFVLPLFYLDPGESSDPQPIAVYLNRPIPVVLRPGLYRLTKSVDLAPGQPRPPYMSVRATFRVIDRETGTAE